MWSCSRSIILSKTLKISTKNWNEEHPFHSWVSALKHARALTQNMNSMMKYWNVRTFLLQLRKEVKLLIATRACAKRKNGRFWEMAIPFSFFAFLDSLSLHYSSPFSWVWKQNTIWRKTRFFIIRFLIMGCQGKNRDLSDCTIFGASSFWSFLFAFRFFSLTMQFICF